MSSKKRRSDGYAATFACGECEFTSEERPALMAHMVQHRCNLSSQHRCSTCHRKFTSCSQLARHVCIDLIGTFTCVYCSSTFTSQATRGKHMQHSHVDNAVLFCVICNIGYENISTMRVHCENCHLNKKVILSCLKCKYKSENVDNIESHKCKKKKVGRNEKASANETATDKERASTNDEAGNDESDEDEETAREKEKASEGKIATRAVSSTADVDEGLPARIRSSSVRTHRRSDSAGEREQGKEKQEVRRDVRGSAEQWLTAGEEVPANHDQEEQVADSSTNAEVGTQSTSPVAPRIKDEPSSPTDSGNSWLDGEYAAASRRDFGKPRRAKLVAMAGIQSMSTVAPPSDASSDAESANEDYESQDNCDDEDDDKLSNSDDEHLPLKVCVGPTAKRRILSLYSDDDNSNESRASPPQKKVCARSPTQQQEQQLYCDICCKSYVLAYRYHRHMEQHHNILKPVVEKRHAAAGAPSTAAAVAGALTAAPSAVASPSDAQTAGSEERSSGLPRISRWPTTATHAPGSLVIDRLHQDSDTVVDTTAASATAAAATAAAAAMAHSSSFPHVRSSPPRQQQQPTVTTATTSLPYISSVQERLYQNPQDREIAVDGVVDSAQPPDGAAPQEGATEVRKAEPSSAPPFDVPAQTATLRQLLSNLSRQAPSGDLVNLRNFLDKPLGGGLSIEMVEFIYGGEVARRYREKQEREGDTVVVAPEVVEKEDEEEKAAMEQPSGSNDLHPAKLEHFTDLTQTRSQTPTSMATQARLCHTCQKIDTVDRYSVNADDLCECYWQFLCKTCGTCFDKVASLRDHIAANHFHHRCVCGTRHETAAGLDYHRQYLCPADIIPRPPPLQPSQVMMVSEGQYSYYVNQDGSGDQAQPT